MTNLLTETLDILKKYGKLPADVLFVTDGDVSCSFEEFAESASIEYDAGYGWEYVTLSLKIVGKQWWLERSEYDGSEWWSFKVKPKRVKQGKVAIWARDLITDEEIKHDNGKR